MSINVLYDSSDENIELRFENEVVVFITLYFKCFCFILLMQR